jgi:hypothetical protein
MNEIIKARGIIDALRLTATKRPHAETERLVRIQERRIAELEARQAPTVELTEDERAWIEHGPSLDYRNAAADADWACA